MADKPSKTPYLRFGEVERPIMGPAVEIVGSAKDPPAAATGKKSTVLRHNEIDDDLAKDICK